MKLTYKITVLNQKEINPIMNLEAMIDPGELINIQEIDNLNLPITLDLYKWYQDIAFNKKYTEASFHKDNHFYKFNIYKNYILGSISLKDNHSDILLEWKDYWGLKKYSDSLNTFDRFIYQYQSSGLNIGKKRISKIFKRCKI